MRSFLYYGVGGALVGLASYYGTDISVRLENTTDVTPVANALQLAAAAGIIGGLVYWLIAGRNAGRWRESRASSARIIRDRSSSAFHFDGASGRRTPHEPHRTADRACHCCCRRPGLRSLSRNRLAHCALFLRFRGCRPQQICFPLLSAVDAGAQHWSVDRSRSCGAGCGSARDQTDFSATQVVDVGPSDRFPDRNHEFWRRA